MNQFYNFLLVVIADWLVVPVILIGGLTMLMLPKAQRFFLISRAAIAALFALWLAKLGSLFYQGERPFVLLGEVPKAAYLNNPGFPSDHTLLVFTITFVVWATTKNKPLSLLLLVMSTLIAIGRVLALVHSPADVIGGITFAFLATWFVFGKSFFTTKKE